jgi:hypothetical protein
MYLFDLNDISKRIPHKVKKIRIICYVKVIL